MYEKLYFFTTIFFVGKNKIIKYSENWGGKRNRKTYLIGIAFLFLIKKRKKHTKKHKNSPNKTKYHQQQNKQTNPPEKPRRKQQLLMKLVVLLLFLGASFFPSLSTSHYVNRVMAKLGPTMKKLAGWWS